MSRNFSDNELNKFVPLHLQEVFLNHKEKHLFLKLQSADPADPPPGGAVIWVSDGTGAGDVGDVLMKYTNAAGTTSNDLVILDAVP